MLGAAPRAHARLRSNARVAAWDARVVALATWLRDDVAVVRLELSDGTVGWGQLGNKDADLAVELLHRRVAPAVLGARANDPWLLVERVLTFELNYKCLGSHLAKAIAGLDAAVWDALGHVARLPVCDLVAGSGGSASSSLRSWAVYASSISRKVAPSALADELARLRDQHGIDMFKVKVGRRMAGAETLARDQAAAASDAEPADTDQWPGRSRQVLAAVRSRLGPRVAIAVDANGALAPRDAQHVDGFCAMLREFGVTWLEEPFPWTEYAAMADLHARLRGSRLLLAGGEQEFRPDVWRQHLPMDIFQPDLGYCGGFSTALAIAELALERGRAFVPHSPQGDLHLVYALHLACAVCDPQQRLELACVDDGLRQVALDRDGAFRSQLFAPALHLREGRLHLHSDIAIVGWGVTVSDAWLAQAEFRPFDANAAAARRSSL
jgi:L-alanine-DL-glutamate epimerase-like enolase superfamily enzyme